MKARIERWGDSLAVRIPIELAEAAAIPEGSEVDIAVMNGRLAVRRARPPVPTLRELVAGITEENRHPETDWGPPVGREVL